MMEADNMPLWMDVGVNESLSGCAVYNQSDFKGQLENRTIGLSPLTVLPGDDTLLNHLVICDNTLLSQQWMMKPVPLTQSDKR